MLFYYALRTLAVYINNVRSDIYGMAVAVRNVWLLGDNLYTWLANISARLIAVVVYIYDMAESWLQVYHYLINLVPDVPNLSTLLYYLDDLLSLVRDFFSYLRNGLRQYFPALFNFNLDPVSYILETIYKFTGLTYAFIHNPNLVITALINAALGDVRNLILNPYNYIVGRLTFGNPLLELLLLQPGLWLRRELNILFPGWERFISNPTDFILETFITGLENLLNRYTARLVKLAEAIINAIF